MVWTLSLAPELLQYLLWALRNPLLFYFTLEQCSFMRHLLLPTWFLPRVGGGLCTTASLHFVYLLLQFVLYSCFFTEAGLIGLHRFCNVVGSEDRTYTFTRPIFLSRCDSSWIFVSTGSWLLGESFYTS